MKTLLEAIKTQLQDDDNLSYIEDDNIFIVPDEDIIPISATFPAIGLKDGGIIRERDTVTSWDIQYLAHIIIYQQLTAGETPLIGQADPRIYGVLEIRDDIDTLLRENYLNIEGIYEAFSPDEAESETIGFKELVLQKKRITYQYKKIEVIS